MVFQGEPTGVQQFQYESGSIGVERNWCFLTHKLDSQRKDVSEFHQLHSLYSVVFIFS